MGWYFSRQSRHQLIQELIEPRDNEQLRAETVAHTLRGNVLWSVVRITAKQEGIKPGLGVGDSYHYIRCDLVESCLLYTSPSPRD